jgi:ubiquinone/menaquinone biosynthesis C-methylase UbiE
LKKQKIHLDIFPPEEYTPIDIHDPLKYYFVPGFKDLYRKRMEMCLSECSGGEKVLEVGFGSGLTFSNLNRLYKKIYGIEKNSPISIADINAYFNNRSIPVYLSSGDLLRMPYPDDEFDTVLIISVLEHLKPHEQARAFSEIHRVIRSGGQLVYGVPFDRPLMTFLYRFLGHKIKNFHFSDQKIIHQQAQKQFGHVKYENIDLLKLRFLSVYQVVNCIK